MSRQIELLKDNIYQLVEYQQEPYDREVLVEGSLQDIEAWLALEERGYSV